MATNNPIDDRRADAVWQRVSPELNPYPEARQRARAERRPPEPPRPEPPFVRPAPEPPRRPTKEITETEALAAAIGTEWEERRAYQMLARRAPQAARRALEQLAAEAGRCAHRLMGVYFLLTGEKYQPEPPRETPPAGNWLSQLRERYRRAAEAAGQYARWAKNTNDPILAEALEELSAGKRRQARALLAVLESVLT